MNGDGAQPSYAARIALLRPETVWSLTDDAIVETSGRRARSQRLADLRAIRLAGAAGTGRRAAHLTFKRGRMIIPAQSLAGAAVLEDRSADFDAFLAALRRASGVSAGSAVEPKAGTTSLAAAVLWGMGLTGAGAVLMVLAALSSGMPGLGLALGARLLFAAILMAAALPWLGRDRSA